MLLVIETADCAEETVSAQFEIPVSRSEAVPLILQTNSPEREDSAISMAALQHWIAEARVDTYKVRERECQCHTLDREGKTQVRSSVATALL